MLVVNITYRKMLINLMCCLNWVVAGDLVYISI